MYKCASFFAGVGGIDKGFENTSYFKTIYANEIDQFPVKTFEENFNIKVDIKDIKNINEKELPNFDVMLAGFPCQSFSIAGHRQGFEDTKGRGTLFFDLVRIFKEKKPKIIFLENVKNLVSHDNGNTFKVILEELKKENYYVKYSVLNAKDYGNVPQNRERIYIVAFKDKEIFKNFSFPMPIPLTTSLDKIIDFNKKVDEKYYYTSGKYKGDIYEQLLNITSTESEKKIYQWRRKYVRTNKSGVIPTLTANQGEGGHNVCIIKTKYGIRKMVPLECFYAQGFPRTFKLPKDLSDTRLYKQAGNSVCVTVIERIALAIKDAILSTKI